MEATEERMRLKDVANAAAILVQAVEGAGSEIATVRTPYGKADVILDDGGADVVLHEHDVTVHVRRN